MLRSGRVAAALLFVAVMLVFAPALRNGFVWDDQNNLVQSGRLRSWHSAVEAFRHPALWSADVSGARVGTYRPLSLTTFVVDYKLYGLRAWGFHLTSILLHALCALVLFALFRVLVPDRSLAFALALLWAVHPVCVEAVVWINGRSEILALLFGSLALLSVATAERRASPATSAQVALCLLLALLGKETAIVFVPLAVWLAAAGRPRTATAVGAVAGSAVYFLLRGAALHGATLPPAGGTLAALRALPAVWIRALQVVVFPLDRSIAMAGSWLRALGAVELAAYYAASALLWALCGYLVWKRKKLMALGLVWWLTALAPVCLLVVMDWPGFHRWLYIGLPGLFLLLGLLIAPRLRPRARVVTVAVLLAGLVIFTERAIPVWHDDGRLFATMVLEQPDDAYGYESLGFIVHNAGRTSESVELWRQAAKLGSQNDIMYGYLAYELARADACDEALRTYRQSDPVPPYRFAEVEGACLQRAGRATEARPFFLRCASRVPACAAAIGQ